MSPSIAAESLLPIAPAPEKNRAVPPAGGQNSESFADVLDEELSTEDEPLTSAKPPENSEPKAVTVDPWTWLGFAQLAPPPSPTISSPPAIPVAASEGETPVLPSSSLNSSSPVALEQNLPLPPAATPPSGEQITLETPEKPEKASGILVAQGQTMQLTTRKQDHSPAPKEQGTAAGSESGLVESFAPTETITMQAVTAAAPILSGSTNSEKEKALPVELSADSLPSFEVELAAEAEPVEPVQAARVVEKIERQVQILRTSGMDKVDLVLRPDADTELLIHVTKVDGQIQVQVRCERGDVALLDSQWSQVQSSLAAQGVRVEPLQHAHGATDFTNSQFSDQKQRQEEQGNFGAEIDRLGTFIEIDPSGGKASAGRPSLVEQSWQRWA